MSSQYTDGKLTYRVLVKSKKPLGRLNVACRPLGSFSAALKMAPGTMELVELALASMNGFDVGSKTTLQQKKHQRAKQQQLVAI